MLKSMTGYGKCSGTVQNKGCTVEIKTLNSRYLDINVKLPALYREKETELRNNVSPALERGKVDINIELEEDTKSQSINKQVFEAYYKELNDLASKFDLPRKEILSAIMKMPDILTSEKETVKKKEWQELVDLTKRAIKLLDEFRAKEGATLEKDLRLRATNIEKNLQGIEKKEKDRVKRIRAKIMEKLQELRDVEDFDESRLEEELVYYIEKLDITEEIVRLKSHCGYFKEVLKAKDGAKGKKLNFISQEMGREINTIGSKAYDAELQKLVVEMKEQLEKIKEQVNNVL